MPRRRRARPDKRPVVDEPTRQQWEHIARSPIQWLISAENLKACAEIVGQRFVDYVARRLPPGASEITEGVPEASFGPVFQMLAGYSIEALVKGVCVAREPDVIVEGKLPEWLTTHDLEALLHRANVQLDDVDWRFLRRLHVSVVWSGRYPVPKSAGQVQKSSSSGDLAAFRRVYDILVPVLQDEMRRAD
jgi:hypothetical protein